MGGLSVAQVLEHFYGKPPLYYRSALFPLPSVFRCLLLSDGSVTQLKTVRLRTPKCPQNNPIDWRTSFDQVQSCKDLNILTVACPIGLAAAFRQLLTCRATSTSPLRCSDLACLGTTYTRRTKSEPILLLFLLLSTKR